MRILEILIYGLFILQSIRWALTIFLMFRMNRFQLHQAKINYSLVDHIMWIAPVVYFCGGLQ